MTLIWKHEYVFLDKLKSALCEICLSSLYTPHIQDEPRQTHKRATIRPQKHMLEVTMYRGCVRIYIIQLQPIPPIWD